jgi:hypothetical protein
MGNSLVFAAISGCLFFLCGAAIQIVRNLERIAKALEKKL